MGAVVAFAMSIDPICAQSPSFAQRIYQDKADCQFCHGPDGDGRGDPRSPGKAPDLHKTAGLGKIFGLFFWAASPMPIAPQGRHWMWASGHIRRAAHSYEPAREAAMAAFGKSWRRES